MKLRAWLELQGMTQSAFAEIVGVSDSTLHRLVTDERLPSREVMAKIAERTAGAVTANDFYAEEAA